LLNHTKLEMKLIHLVSALLFITAGGIAGWLISESYQQGKRIESVDRLAVDSETRSITRIVAQGRILPRSGIINIYIPPGQRIEAIFVREGDLVVRGETELAALTGLQLTDLQRELALSQSEDALWELEQKISAAQAKLSQAKNAEELAEVQLKLARQADLTAVAEKQLEAASQKLQSLEKLAEDPKTRMYVSSVALTEQQLNLQQAEIQLQQARQQRERGIESAELTLNFARQSVLQAEEFLLAVEQMKQQSRTIELSRRLAEKTHQNARLIAPIHGQVLKINGSPGESLLQTPLIQLGDLTNILCRAEVVDRLAPYLELGQKVHLTSPLYPTPVSGRVEQIGRIIGTGSLADPNPLALTDRKTVEVIVAIDPEFQTIAANFVNLQLTLEIDVN
jgi:ABC exporter DevB family membrane fusion protein